MQTTRLTRSSVLGKRAHQQQESSSTAVCEQQLQTPDPTPNPKRVRTSTSAVDGDSNKENVPPFSPEVINMEVSTPRSARALRQTATELVVTPTRARPTPRRHASTSTISSPVTPAGGISYLAISTPPLTPPTALLPLHARARALLRATCNADTQIAGRDSERATIQAFLTSFLGDSDIPFGDATSTSLYISGTPGTGKTALVNSILREMTTDAKVVFINCMALNSVESLWDRLIEELGNTQKQKSAGRSKKVKGRDAVEALLSHHRGKCIIILDELDHITPTTQSLTSLFSLPNTIPSSIRLIGIANTHTLTSSSSSTSSVSAASNVLTVHFAPYTPAQLQQILQSRLQPLYKEDITDEGKAALAAKKLLPPPTLMLLTKKVAALTGDVRSLFEVLRGAIDLAVTASTPASPTPSSISTVDENPLNSPALSVTPSHILAALKAYTPSSTSVPTTKATLPAKAAVATPSTNSEIVAKVNNLGLQARLVLLCILLASRRLEANLPITASTSITSTPKKSPASPIKRAASLPTPTTNGNGVGIDPTQLHTYYGGVLDRSDSGVFEVVSRSEFGDLVGVLEGIGLVSLGGTSDISAGTGAKRAFGRSASFAGGSGFGGAGKGKGKGEVKLVKGVRGDEVLRGLGITAAELDIMEEEVKAIWEREMARLARDLKAIERGKERAAAVANGFEGALED
ncbi:P-loop containing nucleoside triphosphate hydrolase protein [Lyophyllum atratum]|nr:P-loop containing nucleoside triphosphate hydrolase protein [Lyophyllum atratum]